jgi:hypothetical protein
MLCQGPAREPLQVQRQHHRHNHRVEAAQHAQPRPGTDPHLFRAHSSAYGGEDAPRGGDHLGNGRYA